MNFLSSYSVYSDGTSYFVRYHHFIKFRYPTLYCYIYYTNLCVPSSFPSHGNAYERSTTQRLVLTDCPIKTFVPFIESGHGSTSIPCSPFISFFCVKNSLFSILILCFSFSLYDFKVLCLFFLFDFLTFP